MKEEANQKIFCNICGKLGNKNDMNFIMGKYSHKKCDDKYFEKQEKKVKYFRRKTTYYH